MKYTLRLAIILALLWLLLSGYYHTLMLIFGAISVAIVVWLTWRMDEVDKDRFTLFVTGDFVGFLFKLFIKIVQSNIDVCARILGFKPVSSTFIRIELPFDDDLSKVLYANSITLTPGTSSVTLNENELLVHALSEEGAKELAEGDMLNIMPRTNDVKKAMKVQQKVANS